jgi:CHAD domain-containing protein
VNSQHDFIVPSDQSFSELISTLETAFNLHPQAESVSYRIFYDTVDWLLYNNGAVLEMHEDGDSRRIYWRAGKEDQLRIQLGLRQSPRLASDLPDGEFRKQLASIISVRELKPRIKIKIKRIPVVIVNKKEKAIVRINLDESWFYPVKRRAGCLLSKRLTLNPVKGYAEAEQQIEALMQMVDLHPTQDNMLKLALAELGSSTTEHSTKLNLMLDPGMTAEDALREILLRLVDIMQRNTAGSIEGADIEFMHDYRVSIRKTRSALALIKRVLPKDLIKKYKKFFAGLGQLTNPVRDFDVFLVKLDDYKKELAKNKQDQLGPLQRYLIDNRSEAQKHFIEGVKSPQYRQTLNQWRELLEDHTPLDPPLENTNKPVFQLANQLIWSTYQTVLQEGNAITEDTPAEAVHELRKTCKKLRYLIEFFQSLYPAKRVKEVINALKGLQDNLGDFNDYHVHMLILEGFTEQSSDEVAVNACNKMIKGLREKQQKTRNHFGERYTTFSSQNNQDEFRELFVDSSESNGNE